MNYFLLRNCLAAAHGSMLFGFDTAVLSGTTHALKKTYGLSAATLGITASMALRGTALGSLLADDPFWRP